MQHHPGLQFQQDGGPGHTAKYTTEAFRLNNIQVIFWPPYSPDLSPIESLWNRMKEILQELDPRVHRDYLRLKRAVPEAWDSITDAEKRDLIDTMPKRCADCILARGGHTGW